MKRITLTLLSFACLATTTLAAGDSPRERLSMDSDWRFALGNAADPAKDFDTKPGQFSDLAKAGFGSGAAGRDFDDSAWRKLDLPHDWAVELPFSEKGSGSHGFKAIGRNFPENSIGWYRKKFTVPSSDLGKRISLVFDGVFRDAKVWVNGHYLGTEESGYSSFSRNISELLNYGGENVIVVRVDASKEEGWFYEGAGIYRHVWLVKTEPLHVAENGTFVTSEIKENTAAVTARVTIVNDGDKDATFDVAQAILDASGQSIVMATADTFKLPAGGRGEFSKVLPISHPKLWSIETPNLQKLVTTIRSGGKVVDRYETTFGIRSIRFDAKEGFFLNGKHVKIKGTDNHQDHAGVGAAIPDALQAWRIEQLKKFGCNTIRCSHNPPTPEFLDACDRLGMLVIDENRLTGTTDFHYDHLRRLIERDRNHPSVILWSIGNEEWAIEGGDTGKRIATVMQRWVKQLDPTRLSTVAISGGWGNGFSEVIEVAGLNYLGNMGKGHFTTDQWHAHKPDQPIVGTEECAFTQTRGIYFDDPAKCHLRAYDWDPSDWGSNLEEAWKHYADRPYLAGMCIWTGFDYRGEPTPFGWPAISSQFGVLDTCGFPKDGMYYLKSWWTDTPVLHVFPHWNWSGKEGQDIDVWVDSNCDEVELFLNGKSLGRKPMAKNSHLEWKVKYAPGTLLARGYKGGKEVLTDKVETTGQPVAVQLIPDRSSLVADGADVAVFTVQVADAKGRMVPTADNAINFKLTGPGKIIGVGNGDPSSHEPDTFVPTKDNPSPTWSRSLFNGLAQVIVQSTKDAGEITLTATSKGLAPATATLKSLPAKP
jgi:beta-galactosidase